MAAIFRPCVSAQGFEPHHLFINASPEGMRRWEFFLFTARNRFRSSAQSSHAIAAPTPLSTTWQRRIFLAGLSLFGLGVTSFGVGSVLDKPSHNIRPASMSSVDPSAMVGDTLNLPFDINLNAFLGGNDVHVLLYAHDWIRRGDTSVSLLKRMGVQDDELAAWMRNDEGARDVMANPNSKRVNVAYTLEGGVQQLVLRWMPDSDLDSFTRLTISRSDTGVFTSQSEQLDLQRSQRIISGRIESSLFAATDAADIPDSIAMAVAEVFANDIDFNRDLRKGDTFNLVYEQLEADGEPFKTGRLLATQFINNGRELNAIWFANGTTKGEYFDLDGNSTRRFYLASPMEFSRVTSNFAMRFHPIQKRWKRHLGVDYGAPTGTLVRTVGDGRVAFAGVKGGYGNVVEIQHDSKNTTLYAHLSRILVRKGQHIERGDNIGKVGSTGWSTGPHLHFEHRVAGVHKNPALLARNSRAMTIDKSRKQAFLAIAKDMSTQLEAASWMTAQADTN